MPFYWHMYKTPFAVNIGSILVIIIIQLIEKAHITFQVDMLIQFLVSLCILVGFFTSFEQ